MCPSGRRILVSGLHMGKLIAPEAWCRQRWCREGEDAGHRRGDGCSCDPHGEPASDTDGPRRIELTAKAARLAPFACRACGTNTRQLVEYPMLFFRCEPCAVADRWPTFRIRHGH